MNILAISFRFVLVLFGLLFLSASSYCSQKVAVYGVDVPSGESVLAIVDIPDKFFESKEPIVVNLQPQIISRGVYAPSLGSNGSLLFWKGSTLWKFDAGKYLSIFDPNIGTTQDASQAVESSGEVLDAPVVAVGVGGGNGTFYTPILVKHGLRFDVESVVNNQKPSQSNIPISWMGGQHLIILRSEIDLIGRLTQSQFILNSLEKKQEEGVSRVVVSSSKKLTNLPPSSIELLLSTSSDVAAIQVFEQTVNEFKIGIFDIQKQSVLYWIPNPTRNGKSADIEKKKAIGLSWSPSGNDLAISYADSTYIWNAAGKKWRTSGTTGNSVFTFSRPGLLWLDDDQVLTYNFINDGPNLTRDIALERISMSSQNPNSIGIMKDLSIRQVFLLKPTSK